MAAGHCGKGVRPHRPGDTSPFGVACGDATGSEDRPLLASDPHRHPGGAAFNPSPATEEAPMSVSFYALSVPAGDTLALPVAHLEEINLCNGNARALLDLLGLLDPADPDAELCGWLPVGEFAERVALAEVTDPGTARAGFRDGRWHEVGADAAYFQGRLAELSELARAARELPAAAISWA